MRVKSRAMAIASISAVALLATACGGSSDDGGEGGEGGTINAAGCNPENPLVAGNTAETCGGDVLDVLTAKLVHYNPETAEPENDIAESIDTDDNQTFTVKLKKGYKFHDGSEVTSKSFVDAWNYTAYGVNAQQGSYFMEPIAGFEATQCTGTDEDKPCDGDGVPKAKELTGLKVVDDHTFTIKTTEKVSNLPLRLGYTAFAPQPEAFFEDPEAFGDKPIAAGPYKLDSWEKNQAITLSKFADYSGEHGGNADKIVFQNYQDSDAAYVALQSGDLDVVREIPASALVDEKFKTDLGEGQFLEKENSTFQFVGMNYKVDPKLKDIKVRQALSLAIDRKTIVKQIFNDSYTPATGWVSPIVDGYKEGTCGEYCEFNPEKAKTLLKEGGGYEGKLTLTYNGDASHKGWTEAVCNSINKNLGIECVATPTVDFATMLQKLGKGELKGLFRSGWVMDYPSIENYLAPIYGKNAGSNYYDYDSKEFAAKMRAAGAAETPEEANKLYQEAEGMIAKEFTTIPLWYGKTIIGWSENVTDVQATPFGNPDLAAMKIKN